MNTLVENKNLNRKKKVEGVLPLGIIATLIILYLIINLRKPGESVVMFDVFTRLLDGQDVSEEELYDGIQSMFPGGSLNDIAHTSVQLYDGNKKSLGNVAIQKDNIFKNGDLNNYDPARNSDGHLKDLLKQSDEKGFVTEKSVDLTSINGAIDLEKFNHFKELLEFLPEEFTKKLEEYAARDSLKLNFLVSFNYFDGGENSPVRLNSRISLILNLWDPETKQSTTIQRYFQAKDAIKVDYFTKFIVSDSSNPEGVYLSNENAYAFLQGIYKLSDFTVTNESDINFFKTFFEELLPKLVGIEG